MFTLFEKKVSRQKASGSVFMREQQRSETAKRLVQDFPWLWAISSHHSGDAADYIKISQEMADLKTVLALPSKKTSFSIWVITSHSCQVFNMSARCLNPLEDKMWAEAVMQEIFNYSSILYFAKVDPSLHYKRITIFRHPRKIPLNGLVEDVVQLHDSRAQWQVSDDLLS